MFRKQHLKNLLRRLFGERRYSALARFIWPRSEKPSYGDRTIVHDLEGGSGMMCDFVRLGRPGAIGKIGALELRACVAVGNLEEDSMLSPGLLEELHATAGIFPPTTATVRRFAAQFCQVAEEIDVLGVWFVDGEEKFVEQYVHVARLMRILPLEPYAAGRDPWSAHLAGKRVVVVSPFARSIESQYARRSEVWRARPEVLPEFHLRTVKAPLSDYLVKSPHTDWFAALAALKRELAAEPFDVAIIGCGAFSIPLAVEAKRLGGIGIHLGGATQLLFGILGGRWEDSDYLRPFVNESWVRPSGDERPPKIKRVEGGAYW